jgi:glyoxalase family protein
MEPVILGLHHVTATVDDAQQDLDFCSEALGLRLVKKTVNFDNHHVYHFYYGDELGVPGTLWTTFPYKGHGVPLGRKGSGQITSTAFSVPAGSLPFWKARLRQRGLGVQDVAPRFGEESVEVADPSGLAFELVANDRDGRAPWTGGGVGAESAVRGLHSVTMVVRAPAKTLALMTGLLGYEVVNEAEGRTRVAVNGDAPGKTIDIVHALDASPAMNGVGTVHHVAMAIADGDGQLRMRAELERYGLHVTEVRDRCYFTSIYFREPGGVLFEIATVPPGFLIDESAARLGQALQLPPWEEPFRAEIERGLARVTHP